MGDAVDGDWKLTYVCGGLRNFELEVVAGRVNSKPSAATSTKPGAEGGRGRGGGWVEKESTCETFSKSHPLKSSSLP